MGGEKRYERTTDYCKRNYAVGVESNGDRAANDDATLDVSGNGTGSTTIQTKEGAHKHQ
jgi:hypothetical protein